MFSSFFTWTLTFKWCSHVSTGFQSTLSWQKLQYNTSTDAQKLIGNCSAYYSVTWLVFWHTYLKCLVWDRLWSDAPVVPHINDPLRTFSPHERSFFLNQKIEFQLRNSHFHVIQCLTTHSGFIGQVSDPVHNSVIVEITELCSCTSSLQILRLPATDINIQPR